MQNGDIILLPFPFTDLTGSKKRPALVMLSGSLDVIVSFISTAKNGLKKLSLVRTGKIASLDKVLVTGRLGNIHSKQIES